MSQPFISYYEHIAKLAQVANKQTLFLAHILHQMEFNKDNLQYYVDMSTFKKLQIMKEISPGIEDKNLLNLANQYLSKLKKAGFVRNISRGLWLVDPMSYGKYRTVSKSLRTDNARVFAIAIFDKDGIVVERANVETEDGVNDHEEDLQYHKDLDKRVGENGV